MPFDVLVPFATFLAMALAVWGALSLVAEHRSRAADRLERLLRATAERKGGATLLRRQDRLQALVARAAPALAKPLQPKKEADLGKLRLELLNAGFRGEQAVQIYLGIKLLCALVALAVAVPLTLLRRSSLDMTALQIILAAGGVAFYVPGLVLHMIKKKRQESIFLGLPDALDLMVVCVEAGLGLDSAMRRVAGEMVESCPVLCEELAIANFQVQMGRPRKDVLHELGQRTGVDDVRSLAAVLIQAERFGASIAQALRVQSDAMRVRRRQLAEERAAKTAVMLILPLVLFIFPGIFVVLVGPAGIKIATTLMAK
jgi:tight adherence protein C